MKKPDNSYQNKSSASGYGRFFIRDLPPNPSQILTQLVWLKLPWPTKSEVKTFCLSFLSSVDDALGTQYLQTHRRHSIDQIVPEMATIASLHVLVVDVGENTFSNEGDQPVRFANFLGHFSNVTRVPVLVLGPTKIVAHLLQSSWMLLRSGQQSLRTSMDYSVLGLIPQSPHQPKP